MGASLRVVWGWCWDGFGTFLNWFGDGLWIMFGMVLGMVWGWFGALVWGWFEDGLWMVCGGLWDGLGMNIFLSFLLLIIIIIVRQIDGPLRISKRAFLFATHVTLGYEHLRRLPPPSNFVNTILTSAHRDSAVVWLGASHN